MTKAEELKLLEQIDALIKSADAGDYIPMTFAGIVDVCRRNIEDDFGDSPVNDLELERERFHAESRMHDETKRMLADAQKALREAIDENDKLRKTADEWEQNAHDAGEMYCGLEEEIKTQNMEITRLRAEIVRMRLANMTEFDLAELYEKTEAN